MKKATMTTQQHEEALTHAEAIMRLVLSLDDEKYGEEAARAWLEKYGGRLGPAKTGGPINSDR